MTTFTQSQGTRTQVLDLLTLAASNYLASGVIDLGPSIPLDVTFEVECDPNGVPTNPKQIVLFAKFSLDGINFGSGPESLSDSTNEADLHWIGTLSCNDTNVHRKVFSLQGLPVCRYLKLVVKNDMGVSLASGKVYRADITGASA